MKTEIKVGAILYRYKGKVDYDDKVNVFPELYTVIKLTPQGLWVRKQNTLFGENKRWIKAYAKHPFAHLTKKDALELCAVGPTTRASGVKKDVRVDQAYCAYSDLDIDYITPDVLTGEVNGDVYDRIIVRLLEVKQSIEIIEKCIDEMPSGDIMAEPKIPKLLATIKKTAGEGIGRHEAPRGEVIHYVKFDGEHEEPYTWKVRASTYNNILPWIPMLKGEQIADIPIVAASTDPCLSCTNRVAIIDKNRKYMLNKEDLHRLSVKKTRRLMK